MNRTIESHANYKVNWLQIYRIGSHDLNSDEIYLNEIKQSMVTHQEQMLHMCLKKTLFVLEECMLGVQQSHRPVNAQQSGIVKRRHYLPFSCIIKVRQSQHLEAPHRTLLRQRTDPWQYGRNSAYPYAHFTEWQKENNWLISQLFNIVLKIGGTMCKESSSVKGISFYSHTNLSFSTKIFSDCNA